MIKNSKNNESMPDFNDMMNEVEQDMVLQEAEESVIDKVPDLKNVEYQHRECNSNLGERYSSTGVGNPAVSTSRKEAGSFSNNNPR